jgi:phthiocerol/phenolphthiocerol synthesis type-I polyketide synthase C
MKKKRVAILGTAYRLPGTTPADVWPALLEGRNLVTQVPEDRWAQDSYLHPSKSHRGTSYTFAAGTIGDIFGFDADFFGISPREASQMDPQQRLLLEMNWEALENAGIKPSAIRGSNTGVFIGISSIDYSFRFADDLSAIDSGVATGSTASIAANRISYVFDLRGPSVAVDTACSSSLVAFHLACQSIISGESKLAITGGISLHLHPYAFVTFSKASMLSKRGFCNVFDAAGDGYVRSEGGGIFVLKDYDQALADGDPILAVVANSVINSDGRKSGITVPSVDAQVALLQQAYAEAGIDPSAIDYVEAHGTGTAVGDPVETHALGKALGQCRLGGDPLLIGSIKSNLGHLEAASGAAGLVKALLCLRNRSVPATIHIENPNPNIHFDEWNIKVATETTPLKEGGKLVVGVNSFGFGGANAHVILESADASCEAESTTVLAGLLPVVVSGKNEAAAKTAATELSSFLRAGKCSNLYDVAYATNYRRDWHAYRIVTLAGSVETLASALAPEGGRSTGAVTESGLALPVTAKAAFVYSGNGSQWQGMGRALLAQDAEFRDAIRAIDEEFRPLSGYSIEDEFAGRVQSNGYEFTEVAQPALFALQVGYTRMLRSRGVVAAMVAGHSVGEVAAAWAAGALTLRQAVQIIYHRSKQQGATKGMGQMTAIGLGYEAISGLLKQLELDSRVTVAGVNSSRGVTVAGGADALDLLETALAERQVFHRRLDLDYAFHSPVMDKVKTGILNALAGLKPASGSLNFYSAVTGQQLAGQDLGADYWWRNIREPVMFEKAMSGMLADGANVFVEIGPHALLRGYVNEAVREAGKDCRVVATGMRGNESADQIWRAAAKCAIAGVPVDWHPLFAHRARFARLPNYPWQRERYEHAVSAESYQRLHRKKQHPLLGFRLHENEWMWENQVDTQILPMLADHVIGDATVMPGTGFVEMALAAGRQLHAGSVVEIEHLEIRSPLIVSATHAKALRFSIDPADGGFSIQSRDHMSVDSWTLHAVGRLPKEPRSNTLQAAPFFVPVRAADFSGADHEVLTRAAGLAYGPAFKAIESIWVDENSAVASLLVPESIAPEISQMCLHPALLDCTYQLIIQLLRDDYFSKLGTVYVPSSLDGMYFRADRGHPAAAKATLLRCGSHSITASFSLFNAAGETIAHIREARFQSMRLSKNPAERLSYLDCHFVPKPHPLSSAFMPHLLFETLQHKCQNLAQPGRHSVSLIRYASEIEPLLDGLCSRFAARALHSIAMNRGTIDTSEVRVWSEASPETAFLLRYLIDILEEDHLIERTEGGWRFFSAEGLPVAEDIWNRLVADYPEYVPVFLAVGRVGLHLADILHGRVPLNRVLPKDCSPGTLMPVILGQDGGHDLLAAVRDLVRQTLGQLPPGKRLRIIEINGGIPLFASSVCKVINADTCDYVFATSAVPLAEACQRMLEDFPEAGIRQLDPENAANAPLVSADALFQLALVTADFESEQDVAAALKYASVHLASGGAILFLDNHQSRWMDFVFGGRRSWWVSPASQTPASRHKPSTFWKSRLQKLGLRAGSVVELSGNTGVGPYLLVAQKSVKGTAVAQVPLPVHTWVLLADREGDGERLASQVARALESRGDRAIHIVPGGQWAAFNSSHYQLDPADSAHLGRMIQKVCAEFGGIDGIIHLQGFSAASGGGSTLLAFERQLDRCVVAAALHKACEAERLKTRCWLVTSRASTYWLGQSNRRQWDSSPADHMDASLWGFGRTLMNESPDVEFRLLDIEDPASIDTATYAFVRELTHPDAEQEVILSALGDRFVPRLRTESRESLFPELLSASESPTLRLGLQLPGQLRSLRWESYARTLPAQDEVEVEVHASGVNFRDIMYSVGLLSDEAIERGFAGPALGLEFSGVVSSVGAQVRGIAPGSRVLGFGSGCFSSRIVTKAACVAVLPPHLSFEAAATIPSVFLTAYYALSHVARLEEGERVLIHGAAGGVGIAAIQMAKQRGAEIFATAGTEEKRDFLRLLGVDHVLDSRSLAFADEILSITGGEGIDVVLNSLAGEAINRNLRILRPFGRFLELGKRDFQENTKVGLRFFRNNISYFGIDADQLMQERPELTAHLFGEVMRGFAEGDLHPLPYYAFDADHIVDAFRFMQQSRHIGKVIITYRNGISEVHEPHCRTRTLELPSDATYLVTGGLSGFGLKTAQWLADRGARNLVLIGRGGAETEESRSAIHGIEAKGVRVHAAACDVTDYKMLTTMLSEVALIMPPLRGIVHAATVIEDGLIRNLSKSQIRRVFAPKMLGAQYLHQAALGKELDFFVVFSSATTLFGNPGQGSYVAANTYLEAFTASRRAARLPALCVRWGAIDDAGYLARNPQFKDALQGRMGGAAMHSSVALDTLEQLLLHNRSGLGVLELEWASLSRFLPTASAPKFRLLALHSESAAEDDGGGHDVHRLIATLPPVEVTETITRMVRKEVGAILRISPDKIDNHRLLYEMGFDSLMGVELVTAIDVRFSVRLPVMALSDNPTIAKLADRIIGHLTADQGEIAATHAVAMETAARQIAAQHADEHHADAMALTAETMRSAKSGETGRMIH